MRDEDPEKDRRRERYEVRDDDGPSDWIRTSGLMLPKHPRYQLRYTRMSSEETRFVPFPPDGENCTSAPSFFLSKSNPLRWASIWCLRGRRNSLHSVFTIKKQKLLRAGVLYNSRSANAREHSSPRSYLFHLTIPAICGILSKELIEPFHFPSSEVMRPFLLHHVLRSEIL